VNVRRSILSATSILAAAVIAVGAGGASAPVSPKGDPTVSAADWPGFGGDGSERHYSPLKQIDKASVGKLGLAWHYELESGFSLSTPVEAEGKLFVTTGHSHVRAFEAATGKLLWEYDSKTREMFNDPLHLGWGGKGLAYWRGRVVIVTPDGRVIALDAKTGKPLWEQREYDPRELRYTLGAPRVFGGKVIVGHGGADISPIRGYVTAYDAMTGQRLWRFYTTPGDPSKPAETKAEKVMRPTWKGDWFGKGGGGTAWNAFSYDPKLNLIYLGVGNGYPYAQNLRSPGGGDNLFLASIVAVNADTGAYVWHYQVCPAEQWDCTATMDMSLADLTIGGKPRKVLIQAPKNGFVYVIDRATGEFISAEKFAHVTWAERIDPKTGRPVENPGIRYQNAAKLFELWPGPQGAHSWPPQAFSPQTGLLYIPVMDLGALVGPSQPGAVGIGSNLGAMMLADADLPGSRRSYLKAWDPVRQKQVWAVDLPGDWPAGVLATAGGLVFQGRIDGVLVAYDAKTGKPAWSFKAQAPIVGAPIAYSVGGRQYVSVLTGSGSQGGGILATGNAAYRTDYALPRHVLTFAIGGKDKLPAFTPPPLEPPADPGLKPDPALIAKGGMAFASNGCLVCHGMNAVGGGAAPDLRFSPIVVSAESFRSVVKESALRPNGMPGFPQLADDDLEAIRHYLRFRASQAPAELAAIKAGKKPVVYPQMTPSKGF
jgi:quinohemoprotein ethanol dehydrogenase